MNKAFIIFWGAASIFLFSSCAKDSLGVEENVKITKENNYKLNISEGEKFTYLQCIAFNMSDSESSLEFTGDTLVVVVAKEINGIYYIKEEYRDNDIKNIVESTFDSSGYLYSMRSEMDSLIIESPDGELIKSNLFDTLFSRISLPLMDIKENPLTVYDWRVSFQQTAVNKQGFIENFAQIGSFYPRLNVVAFDEQMAYDGKGATIIYSRDDGIVRTSFYGGEKMTFMPDGICWYRLN